MGTRYNMFLIIFITFSTITLFESYATDQINNNYSSRNNSFDFFPKYQKTMISINGFNMTLAIASTHEQRVQGLSGLETLAENEGMLFIFNQPAKQGFLMKDMNFPIDIIWLNSQNRITHIEKSLQPCKLFVTCPVYTPPEDSLYVLEVKSGFSDDHSIMNGMLINFSLNIIN